MFSYHGNLATPVRQKTLDLLSDMRYIVHMEFKDILKKAMAERGLNQVLLSKSVGVRQSQVSNWLSGRSLPTYGSIKKLCEVFGVDANYFFT